MKIYLITRNPGKLLAARTVFSHYPEIDLQPDEHDYPEIQADTSLEIARHTAIEAAKALNAPVIREDHSLFLNALGFPGPYMSYFNRVITPEKLLTLLSGFSDRSGYFEVATVYAEPDGHTKEYTFDVPFIITQDERGDLQSGLNRLIQLKGQSQTLAEYAETERTHIWNKNYLQLATDLSNRK